MRAIQAHRLIFALVVLATVAAATIWTSTAAKQYAATTEILVTPLPQDNQSFLGFDLLRDSGDPTRTVQTAAALVESRDAASLAAEMLNNGHTGSQIIDSISVQPKGESNVLDITVTADSPTQAALTANAFTSAALKIRRETLERQIDAEVSRLEGRRPIDSDTANRIDTLNSLKERGDPTLSLAQKASPSSSPVGASAAIIIGLALLAGLAIGTATAVVLELTAHKIRDEEEAVQLYRLPILARVPVLPRSTHRLKPGDLWPLPPSVREPFRTVVTQLQREERHRVVMFTSGSTGDGKTTSSINLAMTMALGGHSTILLDTDFRKPGVGEALRIDTDRPTPTPLDEWTFVERSLVQVPDVDGLRILTPSAFGAQDEASIEALAERLPSVLEKASKLADYVVVDTPPLGEISDALRITPFVDDIILVVCPGNTNRANYEIMRDLLERSGDQPTGLLLIGDRTGASTTYYGYGMEGQRRGLSNLGNRPEG